MFARALLFAMLVAGPATAQLPMRTLGSNGDRVILIGGDSLAPLDAVPPGEALPRFKRCAAPTPPLGAIRGTGTVTYTLLADGTVDTSTVTAVEARGMSFPGVASAATRVLGQCHFKPARLGGHAVSIRLAQIMKFDTERPRLPNFGSTQRDAHVDGATTTLARLGLGTDTTTVIYREGSRDLDETPLLLSCSPPRVPLGLSPAAATMVYVIDPDGSVDSGAIQITVDHWSGMIPETEAFFRATAMHCHYAPARVLGRPVAMVVEQQIAVRSP